MSTAVDTSSLIGPGPPPGVEKMAKARWAAKHPPKDPKISFAGKTVLVTGSNTGLGFQAALKFAALGASKLILGVRTISKGEAAKNQIVEATGCEPEVIEVLQLDMSVFASVKTFAAKLEAEVDQLDVALLNAGIAAHHFELSPDGWEMALQVNVLSTALLAILLMPKLRRTAVKTGRPASLAFTGSIAHLDIEAKDLRLGPAQGVLDLVNQPEFFDAKRSYGVIKLLGMYVMQGLVDKSFGPNGELEVAVNVACPGFCTSDLGRDWPWYIVWPTKVMQLYYGRSGEQGSRSLVSATLLGKDGHGKFWTNDVFTEPGVMCTSAEGHEMQAQTGNEILDVLQREAPDIRRICDRSVL